MPPLPIVLRWCADDPTPHPPILHLTDCILHFFRGLKKNQEVFTKAVGLVVLHHCCRDLRRVPSSTWPDLRTLCVAIVTSVRQSKWHLGIFVACPLCVCQCALCVATGPAPWDECLCSALHKPEKREDWPGSVTWFRGSFPSGSV